MTERMAASPLAQKTLDRVKERLGGSKPTGVNKLIQLIHDLTSKSESLSVQHLSEMVSREPAILNKVITVANTLGYNPQGVPIDNIDIAIQVIGFEKVRNLAVSLMLVDNAEGQLNPEEVRETAALALSSGLVARELARKNGCFDPELGFVCAIFRNYGRMLMANFLAEDYREARSLASSLDQDDAYIEVFGLTPVELSYHLLKAKQLPKPLHEVLEKVPAYLVTTAAFTHEDDLLALTDLAVKLCELVDAEDLEPADFAARAERLVKDATSSGWSGVELEALLKNVYQQLSALRVAQGGAALHCPLLQRIEALALGKPLPPPLTSRPRPPRPAPSTIAPSAPPDRSQEPSLPSESASPGTTLTLASSQQRLAKGINDLAALFNSRSPDPTQAFGIAERALTSSLHLLHSLILLEEPGTPTFYARYGSGTLFETHRNRGLAQRNGKDVFMLALARGEDVLIENPTDPKIRPFLPQWLADEAKEQPIILLPIKGSVRCFGIICGLSRDRKAFDLVAHSAKETKEIRSYLARLTHATF